MQTLLSAPLKDLHSSVTFAFRDQHSGVAFAFKTLHRDWESDSKVLLRYRRR